MIPLTIPILIPLLGSILIKLLWGIHPLRLPILIIGPILSLIWSIKLYIDSPDNITNLITIFSELSISLSAEPIGLTFLLVVNTLWLIASFYSYGYMIKNNEKRLGNFFMFFSLAIAFANGAALSNNLLTLFIFYELLTIITYPLVTHKGDKESKRSGRIYLLTLLGTSLCFFLPAITYVYILSGSLDFISNGLLNNITNITPISSLALSILLVLFIFGIAKAAIMPFHSWLPAAMVAPTPVSALLHAVAVVKVGVFSIIKIIIYIFGIEILSEIDFVDIIIYLCGFTIIASSIIALGQDNLKKMLAYSTISQLSYVVIALLILTPAGILASNLHLMAHAISKITLFFAAGAIYTATGLTKISEINGIGYKLKVSMFAFTLGSLSLIGMPLLGGFVSKWYIIQSALTAQNLFIIFIITVSTLLNIGYFAPIIYRAYFTENKSKIKLSPLPFSMNLAICLCCILIVGLFFYPDIFIGGIQDAF
tara:strand:+ start:17832 stop:19277 length:1446 start_codon:yes stop_codon:yes gene_type:complete